MTEKEAIESITYLKEELEDNSDDMFVFTTGNIKALEVAKTSLEEIQQYRALGTVEELWEAREKQRAKKGISSKSFVTIHNKCPACGYNLFGNIPSTYCPNCGQHIDWSEVEK